MRNNPRFALRTLLFYAMVMGVVALTPNLVWGGGFAQDDVEVAREAFSSRNFPWYDAAVDDSRDIPFPQRHLPKSADRNKIYNRSPSRSSSTTPAGGTGTAAAPAWGLSFIAWAGVAILIAGLCGLLLWAFFRLESQKLERAKGTPAPRRSLADSIEHLPFQVDQNSGDFRDLARQAYSAGDFRLAMTWLFSHVLVTLDQRGLIRLKKGKTNRQYLNELKRHQPLAHFYQQVMIPFEATFFGDHDLSRADFESCWDGLDQFQNGVNQTSQVAS